MGRRRAVYIRRLIWFVLANSVSNRNVLEPVFLVAEHEAWNHSDSHARSILLFDTWHPEITSKEQVAIRSLFNYMKDSNMIS